MTNPTFVEGERGPRDGIDILVRNHTCNLVTVGKKSAADHNKDIYIYRADPIHPNYFVPNEKRYIHFAKLHDPNQVSGFATLRPTDKWVHKRYGNVAGHMMTRRPGEPKLRDMSGLILAGTLARERRNQERQQAARDARYAEHRAAAHAAAHANPAPVIANPAPVSANPAPVIANPAPVIANPAPVIANPAPVADDVDEAKTCIICLTNVKSHAFSCGHFKTCGSCSASMNRCPLCRKPGRAFKIFE